MDFLGHIKFLLFNHKTSKMAIKTYRRITTNVSKEGNSYRVRLQKNGKRKSKCFSTRKEAMAYRAKNA